MLALLVLWSHAARRLALTARSPSFSCAAGTAIRRNRPLVAAFAVISVWAIFLAVLGRYDLLAQLAESARNLAFLAFMYGDRAEREATPAASAR